MQSITILGATGSIGRSTLDVIAQHPAKYRVFALTGQTQLDLLARQSIEFNAQYAVVTDENSARQLSELIKALKGQTEVLFGEQALCDVSSSSEVQIVMAAIVGAAGLMPTLSAVESSKKVLLANKESLVMAGFFFF